MAMIPVESAIRAAWAARLGLDTATNITKKDYAKSNGYTDFWLNAAGTGVISTLGVDSLNNVHLAGEVVNGQRMMKTFKLATNGSLTTQAFWIADDNYVISSIQCNFATADGATNTAFIGKSTGTQTPAQAVSLMTNTFNMNGTANTPQTATLTNRNIPAQPAIQIAKGDRLVFVLANAVTSLAGVTITVAMLTGNKSLTAEYVMNANGDLIAATSFFVGLGEYTITGVQAVWSAAGTDAGTVTFDVFKDGSGTAAGGGTSILSAAVSVKTAPNTVASAALSATASVLRMSSGDRLSAKLNGTLTALAGVVIVVSLTPIQGCIDISWNLAKNANLGVDQCIFIAERTYQLTDGGCSYATAAGGALTLAFTRETATSTTAPGAGTSLISGTLNLNSTTNTPAFITALSPHASYLLKGDRLSIHFSAAAQSLAGLAVSAKLNPC